MEAVSLLSLAYVSKPFFVKRNNLHHINNDSAYSLLNDILQAIRWWDELSSFPNDSN